MWKLTIERNYSVEIDGKMYGTQANIHCEAEHLGELVLIVEALKPHAIDGEYKYKIENVEKGEEKDA